MSDSSPGAKSGGAIEDVLGSERQTKKVLSSLRLKVAFMIFVSALLIGLCSLIFSLVSQIFAVLTPAIRADLEWKATRGAESAIEGSAVGRIAMFVSTARIEAGARLKH